MCGFLVHYSHMISFFKPKKTIAVHNGKYHDDDIFACATLLLMLEKRGERGVITRTRDEAIIQASDYVCDVGGIYDPATNRFDHHQPEGAGKRDNGIPYASFGLVWKTYGTEVTGSESIAQFVDARIAQGIDALDNGVQISTPTFEGVFQYSFHDIVRTFRPSWKETFDIDDAFLKSVDLAKHALSREIIRMRDEQLAEQFVEQDYQNARDKRIIILSSFYPWKETISKYPEPLYAVWQNPTEKTWVVMAVRDDWNSFVNRKDMPALWSGLRDAEFEQVSGVPGALFCHRGVWLATAKTKEAALALAQIAVDG